MEINVNIPEMLPEKFSDRYLSLINDALVDNRNSNAIEPENYKVHQFGNESSLEMVRLFGILHS